MRLIQWIGVAKGKFYEWRKRYGKVNEHNALVPRDFWLEEWEKEAIIKFHKEHPGEGYRRITYMMLDQNIVAVSPATTYRVLSKEGLLRKWGKSPSKKGTGFVQPVTVHMHWHIDISHINIRGTYFFVCDIIDGYSRFIIHWDIRASMTEKDIEIILQQAHEKFPDAKPIIISDNGPQFIAKDFKQFIRDHDMKHVRTSPYYPQSNGKIESFHKTLKKECIRPKAPLTLDEARRVMKEYIAAYNNERLNSAIGYIAPINKLEGREKIIFDERDRKLEERREQRRQLWITIRKIGEKIPLTKEAYCETIHNAGQTETGSAGEQPVRDVRAIV